MRIKIYQINMERDDEGCAYMGMDFVNRKLGLDDPASEIYEQVFDGEIDGKSPEDVFAKFNWDHPEGYRGQISFYFRCCRDHRRRGSGTRILFL